MRFRSYGGIHQFVVTDEEDLAQIDALDPARWAATSAPLGDLHCDPAFLAFLDPEGSGRIRVSQLIAAREWLFLRLGRRTRIRERTDVLHLDDLRADEAAGQKLRAAAEHVLSQLGLADRSRLAVADVRAFRAGYVKTLANGDGVVPPEVLPESDVADFVKNIIAVTGGAKDAGGSDGAGLAELDRFIDRGRNWLAWRGRSATVLAFGTDTVAADELVAALDPKIEEFFWHCDLLSHEARSADALRLEPGDLGALGTKDAATIERFLAASPLATPNAACTLSLAEPVNPVYRDRFDELRVKVIQRVLGDEAASLSRASWRRVKGELDAYRAWCAQRPPEPFEALGEEGLRAMLDGPLPSRLTHFIAIDRAAGGELAEIGQLEKLILFQRWLLDLANNFVNFSAIYLPGEQALVEMGSLVIDGRRVDFCVKVEERGAHKKVASQSLIYLVYAAVTARDGIAPAYEVVAPVTSGERGRLRIGKRGIFIDIDGKEWDATVVDIVENPISVKEAALAPFRRASQFVSKKIEDWVGSAQASQEKSMLDSADKGVTAAQTSAEQAARDVAAGKAPPPAKVVAAPAEKKEAEGLNVNTLVLGGGIALAGASAVVASLFGMLSTLKGWLAVFGIIAAVGGLSGLLGWLKLRRRDMSLILEASGWAVNVHMKINRRIGRIFTFIPDLPPGSIKERLDALEPESGGGGRGLFVLGLLAGAGYLVYRYQLWRLVWGLFHG